MAALIAVKLCLSGHPARIPHLPVFVNIVVMSVGIQRNVIVAVSGEAQKLGIFIEAVPSSCVGNKGEKVLASQVMVFWRECFGLKG